MSNNKLIIIAHGWSSTINDWNHIELLLKNSGYIVVNIPFPGLDNKTHINIMLERVWGIPEYSEYVKNIIISEEKKYSPKEIIFIGHSFGGRIGLYIGSHYPGIFTKLILTSSAGINSKVRFKTKLLAIFAKFLKILPIPLIFLIALDNLSPKYSNILTSFLNYFTITYNSLSNNFNKK